MIQYNEKDLADPQTRMESADAWDILQRSDPAKLRVMLLALTHRDYLKTPYWRAISKKIRKRDGFRCVLCNSCDQPQVHHRTYENKGEDHIHLGDLVTLCRRCHAKHHDRPFNVRSAPAFKQSARIPPMSAAAKRKQSTTPCNRGDLSHYHIHAHAIIHPSFNPKRLVKWLDSDPRRWRAFASVADANQASLDRP